MELTYEEKLQLDNGKEHLQVVLGNIRIASGELTKIYELLAEAKIDISKANEDKERILRENSEALLEISIKRSDLDNWEKSIILKDNAIKEKEKDMQSKIAVANSKLEEINNKIAISESNYGKIINDKGREIEILTDTIRELNYEIEKLKEESKQKLGIKTKLENEISGLSNQIEEAKKEFERFKVISKDEIESIIVQQEQEREKIKNPLETIKFEQSKLDRKLLNLQIIKARLTKQFKAQNPDMDLPIDLQDDN